MPIVHPCRSTECQTLTMGIYCLEHEHCLTPASLPDLLYPTTRRMDRVAASDAPRARVAVEAVSARPVVTG
jgi:hypothetical protein